MTDAKLSPIKQACAIAGGQGRLAKLLGITSSTVNQWVTGKRPIPAERCIQIEKVTSRAVVCEDLCPGSDWSYIRAGKGKKGNL